MNNRERGERVRHQIQLRLDTLRGWSSDGIPNGQELPRSLNQVRCWDDPAVGISKIGSPGSFSTKHPEHGTSVRAIAEVLKVLLKRERETRPRDPSLATQLRDERRRTAGLKKTLENSADQYAAIAVEFGETSRDLRVTRQSLESVTAENSELRQKISERCRPRDRHSDSKVVAHINSRRTS